MGDNLPPDIQPGLCDIPWFAKWCWWKLCTHYIIISFKWHVICWLQCWNKFFSMLIVKAFTSPEGKKLMVNYCNRWMSVVSRLSSTFIKHYTKNLLWIRFLQLTIRSIPMVYNQPIVSRYICYFVILLQHKTLLTSVFQTFTVDVTDSNTVFEKRLPTPSTALCVRMKLKQTGLIG